MTTIRGILPASLRGVLRRVVRVVRPPIHETSFRRHIAEGEGPTLAKHISRLIGVPVSADEVQSVAAEVRRIEESMIGRAAGDVEDYVLYYLVVQRSSRLPTALPRAHAEIGVLFGAGLLLALRSLAANASSDWVVGVDPFEGYYGQSRDPATGKRVREGAVLKNAAKLGLSSERLRLIPLRSDDPAAIEKVSGYSLASLWIDGDHSFEGVQRDWHNYAKMVCPGGYVLFDNYHDEAWPEVGRFIDGTLLPKLQGWQVAGSLGRSFLLRKVD